MHLIGNADRLAMEKFEEITKKSHTKSRTEAQEIGELKNILTQKEDLIRLFYWICEIHAPVAQLDRATDF